MNIEDSIDDPTDEVDADSKITDLDADIKKTDEKIRLN